ncbi:MAG: hypothetical protein F2599_03605 [Actinobacteria bacterium]|uniref:Unannotated protein n=1 Tax=freshwater metagenome TaxID=449393 RepID=A0A6J6IDS9_9ZZZZ|nr:hypothetical protein [Actinomycetota bacterium]
MNPISVPHLIELALEKGGSKVVSTVSTFGAALKTLSVNETEIITPTKGHEPNPYGDGIVLAPWANRIDRGQWQLDDKTLQLDVNEKELDNALHGLVAKNVFEVTSQTKDSVTLQTFIEPTTGYPFSLKISVTYQLTENGISTLHTATNIGSEVAPFMVGTHPYFQISGTPTEDLEIKTTASSIDLVNDRKIPIERTEIAGTHFDITDWRKLSTCDFDHGFGDFERDDQGRGHTWLRSPGGQVLDVWQSAEMKYAFIFTPDFYYNTSDSTKRHAIAIEPQTAAANAFNSKEDLIWLEPNQVFEASWGAELTTSS